MSTLVKITFQLLGHFAGQTIKLGKYQFDEGQVTVTGPAEEVAMAGRALERNWQALPLGDPRLDKESKGGKRHIQEAEKPDEQHAVSGDIQPDGAGTSDGGDEDNGSGASADATGDAGAVSTGDGPQEGVNLKLQKALKKMDPKIEAHWTKDGKPALSAVEKLYGASDFTRADVNLAAPGLTRKSTKAK